jgi:5-methylcytosine-specific restriction endonuclease McrA
MGTLKSDIAREGKKRRARRYKRTSEVARAGKKRRNKNYKLRPKSELALAGIRRRDLRRRLKHRDRIAKRMAVRRAEIKAALRRFVSDIKLAAGCALCGYRQASIALDFDHLDPSVKHGRVSTIAGGSGSLETLKALVLEEIAKCRVLCANCHRIETERLKQYVPRHLVERA